MVVIVVITTFWIRSRTYKRDLKKLDSEIENDFLEDFADTSNDNEEVLINWLEEEQMREEIEREKI